MFKVGGSGDRIRPPRILSHFALAAIGLVLWIIYAAATRTASPGPRSPSWRSWRSSGSACSSFGSGQRSHDTVAAGAATSVPAERHFPNVVVAGHGLLAATTLVLVFLVAIGVGDWAPAAVFARSRVS